MRKTCQPNHVSLIGDEPDRPPRWLPWYRIRVRWSLWLLWLINRHAYPTASIADLKARKQSDTLFIFGTGSSLHDITQEQWQEIGRHNTMGFSWFPYQRFIRVDYQLVREITALLSLKFIRRLIVHYSSLVRENSFFQETIFLMQGERKGIASAWLVGGRHFPRRNQIFWFTTRSRSKYEPPSRSFSDGLVHGAGSLIDCLNVAFLLDFKTIVLCGIDMYNQGHFWQGDDWTGGQHKGWTKEDTSKTHLNVKNGMITYVQRWAEEFAKDGKRIFVLNPRSLLATQAGIPVYSFQTTSNQDQNSETS